MPMQLINANLSPYTTRNRIQIRAKGLDKEISLIPRMEPDAYKLIAPTGRIPCLEVADGVHLIESETIAEFIEDTFPAPSLRGSGALGKARVRLFARLLDLYFLAGLNILFGQFAANPRDPAKIEEGLAKIDEGLAHIEHYLPEGARYAAENRLTLADCALAPAFFFANVVPGAFGKAAFLGHAKAKAYFDAISAADPHVKRAVAEMGVALQEFLTPKAA